VGTPASSTTTTGRHDIAEILLKVALNTKKSNQYKCPSCFHWQNRGRRVRMVVEFTTTYATSASTIKVVSSNLALSIGRWLSPGTPVSSTNKTDRYDITEILLKVALNIITVNP
jgi:hypothetical protein